MRVIKLERLLMALEKRIEILENRQKPETYVPKRGRPRKVEDASSSAA